MVSVRARRGPLTHCSPIAHLLHPAREVESVRVLKWHGADEGEGESELGADI